MKEIVKILFVGDEGVGKSSLLSTYISRHFPQEVPAVVYDTIIPADVVAEGVCITFMDSSARLADRESLRSKLLSADSIILIHDVTRPETFDNIVHLWIPIIKDVLQETIQEKPFILLGSKIDLINEDEFSPDYISEIFNEYPLLPILDVSFCSSLRLQNIDAVIRFAYTSVLFPIIPLVIDQRRLNPNNGFLSPTCNEFTPSAYRAFSRVFRILDEDGDNVLNDEEMMAIDNRCSFPWGVIDTTDLIMVKRLVQAHNPDNALTENGDFTFTGFIELLIKHFIDRDNYQYPWTILRCYYYDDQLKIQIPPEILVVPELQREESYRLSDNAIRFLLVTARNAFEENTRAARSVTDSDSTSEVEDCLTQSALKAIFAILPPEHYSLLPWLKPPAYQSNWPYDKRLIDPIEQCTLLTQFHHENANVSFDAWLIHWNVLAFSEPVLVQKLLFLLGYVDRPDLGIDVQSGNIYTLHQHRQQQAKSLSLSFWRKPKPSAPLPLPLTMKKSGIPSEVKLRASRKHMINICVLGDNEVGKSSFVWLLSGLRIPGSNNPFFMFDDDEHDIVEKNREYEKAEEAIVVGGSLFELTDESSLQVSLSRSNLPALTLPDATALPLNPLVRNTTLDINRSRSHAVYFTVTAVPMEHIQIWREKSISQYDLILLMFSADSRSSVDTVLTLDKNLPNNIPRHFLCNKMDLLQPRNVTEEIRTIYEENAERINLHIKEHEYLPFTSVSNVTGDAVTEVVPILKLLYQRPELGIKKALKRVKTWKETIWDFFFGVSSTSTTSFDEKDRALRGSSTMNGVFTPGNILLMTGLGVVSVFWGGYYLAQYNSTVRIYYQQFMKDVQTWIHLTNNWVNTLPLGLPQLPMKFSRKHGGNPNNTSSSNHDSLVGGPTRDSWGTYLSETINWWTKKN